MKLSDYQDEKALDMLADLLEPVSEICTDDEIKKIYRAKQSNLKLVKAIIKNHKKAIIEILAIMDDVPVEEYHANIFTLPAKILEILNDPDFIGLFQSQGQVADKTSSGSATENTEAGER